MPTTDLFSIVDFLDLKDKGKMREGEHKCLSHIRVSCKSLFFSPSITQGGFPEVTLITLALLNLAPRLLWKRGDLGFTHLTNPAPYPSFYEENARENFNR